MRQVKQVIFDDAGYYALIIAYAATALVAALILGDTKWFNPFVYASRWSSGIGLVCCAVGGLSMWRARGATDFVAATAGELKKFATPDAMSGLLLFFCIGLFYGTFTSTKTMLPQFVPFSWDHTFAEIDAALHGADPWVYLQWLRPFDSLVRKLLCRLGDRPDVRDADDLRHQAGVPTAISLDVFCLLDCSRNHRAAYVHGRRANLFRRPHW